MNKEGLKLFFSLFVYLNDSRFSAIFYRCDARTDDGSFGRLLNDDHKQLNCIAKKIVVQEKPYLAIFARNDITSGAELRYNYGNEDYFWRHQRCKYYLYIFETAPVKF